MRYFELSKISLILNGNCNLNCNYCYHKKNNKEMSVNTFKKIISLAKKTNGKSKKIVLIGGEPLLNYKLFNQFLKIISIEKKKNTDKKIVFILNTNGIFLNKYPLEKMNLFDNISISLDGSYETNKKRSENYEEFKQIINNLKLFKRNKNVSISKVITPDNVERIFIDTKFLIKFKKKISFSIAKGNTKWTKQKQLILSNELKKIYNHFIIEKKQRYLLNTFFRINIRSCPYNSITINQREEIYNCEILSSLNRPFISKLNTYPKKITCTYSILNNVCITEACLHCKNICDYEKMNLSTKQNKTYLQCLKFKEATLKKIIGRGLISVPPNIQINSIKKIDLNKINKLATFLSSIYSTIFFNRKKISRIYVVSKNKKIVDILNKFLKNKQYILIWKEKIKTEKLIFDLDNEELILKNKKKKHIAYLNETEIDLSRFK